MPRFMCTLLDCADDDDAWFDIEAVHAEAAARAFVKYLDDRDCEAFPKPDVAHKVVVKGDSKSETYTLVYEWVKSWRVPMSANA